MKISQVTHTALHKHHRQYRLPPYTHAGFKECVKLEDADSGSLDISIQCSMLAPFELMDNLLQFAEDKVENEEKINEIEEEITKLETNKIKLVNEIPSYASSVETIVKQIEAEKVKYNECRTKGTPYCTYISHAILRTNTFHQKHLISNAI